MQTSSVSTSKYRRTLLAIASASICLMAFSVVASAQSRGGPPPAKGLPPMPVVPPELRAKPPQSLSERFADRNERALLAFQYSRCMLATIVAGRTGKIGAIPSGDLAICIRQKGEWRGVFGNFDESKTGFAVHLQYSMLGNGTVVKSLIDTALVAGAARALVRASSIPFPGSPAHEFLPVILQQKGFFELWFLSAQMDPTHGVIGGDSLIQLSVDGQKELGHSKSAPLARKIEVTPGEEFVIQSSETDIPTISELIAGNAAAGIVNKLTVRTLHWDWVRTRSEPKWRRIPLSS
ncbi:MAG: hypothetical protein ABJB66_07015 [Gemmatimonadaceae bacterium]